MTGLINAARKGRVDVARLLASNGADLDIGDVRNRTALFHAVSFGHFDFVKEIIELGANPSTVDSHGWTPLDMARSQQRTKIEAILEQAGAESRATETIEKCTDGESESDKVRDLIATKITERLGENHYVEFGCFQSTNRASSLTTWTKLRSTAMLSFVAEPNDCWDDDCQGVYRSACLSQPTWMDLCVVLQEQIEFSGDTGHNVLEDILHVGTTTIDGTKVQLYQFVLGS